MAIGSPYVAMQLERIKGRSAWTRLRMWKNKDREGEGDLFLLGEPVFIRKFQLLALPGFPKGENVVWWIQEFYEVDDAPRVHVAAYRDGRSPKMSFEAEVLEKLNAMERLAAEYSDP